MTSSSESFAKVERDDKIQELFALTLLQKIWRQMSFQRNCKNLFTKAEEPSHNTWELVFQNKKVTKGETPKS